MRGGEGKWYGKMYKPLASSRGGWGGKEWQMEMWLCGNAVLQMLVFANRLTWRFCVFSHVPLNRNIPRSYPITSHRQRTADGT
jgi:hypothetical protein